MKNIRKVNILMVIVMITSLLMMGCGVRNNNSYSAPDVVINPNNNNITPVSKEKSEDVTEVDASDEIKELLKSENLSKKNSWKLKKV